MTDRDRLKRLLVERSLRIGDFTLTSGARSTYYIDARTTTMCAEGQRLIGQLALAAVRSLSPDVGWVGGLTLGSDPIAYAVAHRSALAGTPIDAFTIRKQAKDHGTGRRIEGGLPPGADVVVVEDTLTSGRSALEAVAVIEDLGATVHGVFALVDREAGGRQTIEEQGHPLTAMFTASELLDSAEHPAGA